MHLYNTYSHSTFSMVIRECFDDRSREMSVGNDENYYNITYNYETEENKAMD